jgi:hypothetical protein
MMKLWLISQNVNNDWDTYDSAVVVAPDEAAARLIHPGGSCIWRDDAWRYADGSKYTSFTDGPWTAPANVSAKYVGEAAEGLSDGEIVCASFNAG